jgi:RNA recognition motif-containing protein
MMDISSLLSPQDSPISAESPKRPSLIQQIHSSSSRAQSTGSNSFKRDGASSQSPKQASLDTSATPATTPASGQMQSRYAGGNAAPTGTPTAGIDTLADVASLQQQQPSQPSRSGSLAAEILRPQNQLPLSYASLSGWQSTATETADATRQRPRIFRAASLTTTDLGQIAKLVSSISDNSFDFTAHLELINLLHKGFLAHVDAVGSSDAHTYELLNDLRRARKAMDDKFPVGETLWLDWISDECLVAHSLEEKVEIMELCKRAVEEEVGSTKLWSLYGGWIRTLYDAVTSQQEGWSEEEIEIGKELFTWDSLLDVWRQAAVATRWRLNDSNVTWDQYIQLLLEDLENNRSQSKINSVRDVFLNRLKTPHATWDQTFQLYSTFITTYDNAAYEETMVSTLKMSAEAKAKYEAREILELNLANATTVDEEWAAYSEYIEFETNPKPKKNLPDRTLCSALFDRALIRYGVEASLWEDYVFFILDKADIGPDAIPILPVLKRATRHCPWSGTLWSQYLLSAEKAFQPFQEIETIKHHATQTGLIDIGGLEEMLKVLATWCGYLKRRAFSASSTEDDHDVAELGIRSALESANEMGKQKFGDGYRGDPTMRLERIYIGFLSSINNWEQARMVWKSMLRTRGNEYSYWFRYYRWEMLCWGKHTNGSYNSEVAPDKRPSAPTQATHVLRQAVLRPNLDWPDKIFETYINHVEDHENVELVQDATLLLRKQTRLLQKRRVSEIEHGGLIQPGPPIEGYEHVNGYSAKRKREDELDTNESNDASAKKTKTHGAEDEMDTSENTAAEDASLKRDREHTTIVVKNLPASVTEVKLRRFFLDCGAINRILLAQDGDGMMATVEFETREDVLTAQTKDMKKFEGQSIQVQVGSGSTLWVTNFPATADEAYIRKLFQPYGEIVDIRFPSLKYNTHRRFCYVQFKLGSDALKAAELNGQKLGEKERLVAKISDPSRKEGRSGAVHEDREIYVSNIDWTATDTEIRELFSKYGSVESVRILKNLAGKSKGIAFIDMATKEEATEALALNLTKFKSRILNVSISESNPAKRQTFGSGRVRSQSQTPELTNGATPEADADAAPSSATTGPSISTIRSKTFAVLGLPDTFNSARLTEIFSAYGPLVKVQLRPDHGGAIIEYVNTADAGKAELAAEGMEVEPGRRIRVGTVPQLLKQKDEKKASVNGAPLATKQTETSAMPFIPLKRPGASRARIGLGAKRKLPAATINGTSSAAANAMDVDQAANPAPAVGHVKSNADFKAMFSKS